LWWLAQQNLAVRSTEGQHLGANGRGVTFQVLRAVELDVDGRAADLGPARQKCVLVALLRDVNKVVSTGQLADRVWGGNPPSTARATLQSYLSRIREALGRAKNVTVASRSDGYVLTVDPEAVDLHRFRRLVAEARAAGTDERAAPLLGEALAQWQGEAFAWLDTPWLNNIQETLAKERHEAELDYVDLELRSGWHSGLLSELFACAAEHPLDERIADQFMVALYLNGRQADALEHYRQLQSRLAEQLGIDPSPALRQRHRQILAGEAVTGRRLPRVLPSPMTSTSSPGGQTNCG
jgi:DNA-binding SARP family transcriptional activator